MHACAHVPGCLARWAGGRESKGGYRKGTEGAVCCVYPWLRHGGCSCGGAGERFGGRRWLVAEQPQLSRHVEGVLCGTPAERPATSVLCATHCCPVASHVSYWCGGLSVAIFFEPSGCRMAMPLCVDSHTHARDQHPTCALMAWLAKERLRAHVRLATLHAHVAWVTRTGHGCSCARGWAPDTHRHTWLAAPHAHATGCLTHTHVWLAAPHLCVRARVVSWRT